MRLVSADKSNGWFQLYTLHGREMDRHHLAHLLLYHRIERRWRRRWLRKRAALLLHNVEHGRKENVAASALFKRPAERAKHTTHLSRYPPALAPAERRSSSPRGDPQPQSSAPLPGPATKSPGPPWGRKRLRGRRMPGCCHRKTCPPRFSLPQPRRVSRRPRASLWRVPPVYARWAGLRRLGRWGQGRLRPRSAVKPAAQALSTASEWRQT